MSFPERLHKLDFRWIWAVTLAIVLVSVLFPVALPMGMSGSTRQVIAWIDSLPKGSVLFIAPEYGPGPDVELNPQVRAIAILAFRHGLKLVIGSSGNILGPQEAETMVAEAAKQAGGGLKYGVNWVNIGYKPGNQEAENELERNFTAGSQGVDLYGKPLAGYPLTRGIRRLDSQYFSGIWAEDTGTPGCIDWYANAAVPGKLPLACGAITMEIPSLQTYVSAGQYKALLHGAAGAAQLEEYERAPGLGLATQEAAAFAAVFIILLVVAGNVAYFGMRRAGGGKSA